MGVNEEQAGLGEEVEAALEEVEFWARAAGRVVEKRLIARRLGDENKAASLGARVEWTCYWS
jgi:hypothetical protein